MEIPICKSLGHTCSSGSSDCCPVPCNKNVNDRGRGNRIPPLGVHRSSRVSSRHGLHPSIAFPSGIDAPKGHPWLAAQVFKLLRG